MTEIQISLFDYALLDSDTRRIVENEDRQFDTNMNDAGSSFLEACHNLTRINEALRYKHPGFVEYCQSKEGLSVATAYKMVNVSKKFLHCRNISASPSALYLLASPSTPDFIRDEVIERAESGEKITPQLVKDMVWQVAPEIEPSGDLVRGPIGNYHQKGELKTCDKCGQVWMADLPYCPYCNISREARIAYVQEQRKGSQSSMDVHYSSETPEWYTPDEIISRVVLTFGEIDLDPCSNSRESPNVPAKHHLIEEDNGLAYEWGGRVYMNPPYGREIGDWTSHLKEQYECGNVIEAIALVPSRTDTEWFRELRDYPRCFIWGRLKFSESENSAPFPSMVVYFGKNLEVFKKVFGDIGDVYCLS